MMLCHRIPVDFHGRNSDGFPLRKVREEVLPDCGAEVAGAVYKSRPLGGKVVRQAEEQGEISAIGGLLEEVIEGGLYFRHIHTLSCSVADVENDIRDGHVVE